MSIPMHQGNYLPTYTDRGGNHFTYCDEVAMRKYTDEVAGKRRQQNIRAFIVTLAVAIGVVIAFWITEKLDRMPKETTASGTEICVMSDASEYIGEDREMVEEELRAAGFVNVECMAKHDLVTGWITHPGTVCRVSIAGNPKFEEGDVFSVEDTVIVQYHEK